jgi:hypothetical protein
MKSRLLRGLEKPKDTGFVELIQSAGVGPVKFFIIRTKHGMDSIKK